VHGSITKTGSKYARRILVEAAWHYARPPRVGRTLYERQKGLPDHVLQIASRAQHRLYRVHKRMRERKKPGNVITVACARELACFLWAAARPPSVARNRSRSWPLSRSASWRTRSRRGARATAS
jgi:transposase